MKKLSPAPKAPKVQKPKPATQVTAFYGDRNQQSLTLPISLPLKEKIHRLRKLFRDLHRVEIDGELYTFGKRKVTHIPTVQEIDVS